MIHRHTEIWKRQRKHISLTFDPRDTLLSLQMGFSFVRAAVACAVLERTFTLKAAKSRQQNLCLQVQKLLYPN